MKQYSNGVIVRNSGIELLKIFCIFLIVIAHVVGTLRTENSLITYQDYVLDLSVATTNVQNLILSMLAYSGAIGNDVFFICSAWFLLDSEKFSGKKWFFILIEVWVISVIILAITGFLNPGILGKKLIVRCLMPTTFSTNWYITCYLLFYPIHPILNRVIKGMSQLQLLRSSVALAVLYIVFNFIKYRLFFSSAIVLWITIYFVIAYVKFYLTDISSSKKANYILLCFGILGHFSIILFTNFLGLKISFFSDKLLYWNHNCNPFIILSVIALFNLVRTSNFKNCYINHVSRLSLIIYIIHDNFILAEYYRPYALNYIYKNYGYSHILLWVLLLAIVIFIGSIIISLIYEIILRRTVNKFSQLIYKICKAVLHKCEAFVLRIH